MIGLIKLMVLVDEDLVGTTAHTRMELALQRQRDTIMAATDNRLGSEWKTVPYKYSIDNIPWSRNSYNGKVMYIPSAQYVQDMTDRHRGDSDFLQMIILADNWKPPTGIIGGFNIFETQTLQAQLWWTIDVWFATLEEELVHSFDQIAMNRLGVNFNKMFDVKYYDNAVVHGQDSRYTRSRYGPLYEKAADTLIELFPNKNNMGKQLIKFTDENHIYIAVEEGQLAHIESPEALQKAISRGFAKEPVVELAPEARAQYKKVGVWVEFPPTDL